MIIDKEIISQISRDYIFISGVFDIDEKYFKKKIEEGVQSSNINYKTNVVGQHTEWGFFNNDKKFMTLLFQINDYLKNSNIKLYAYHLKEAWGLIENFGEYTKKHDHLPAYLSGSLYINDHYQKLYFPEINQEITPQKGRFVLFSSFLIHHTNRNLKHEKKYAVSFNFDYNL
jgi:hypothetical protein